MISAIEPSQVAIQISSVIQTLNIRSTINFDCGDWSGWQRLVDWNKIGCNYIGFSSRYNRVKEFRSSGVGFYPWNPGSINLDNLSADLVILDSGWSGLPGSDRLSMIDAIKRSGAKYIITLSVGNESRNAALDLGWYPIDKFPILRFVGVSIWSLTRNPKTKAVQKTIAEQPKVEEPVVPAAPEEPAPEEPAPVQKTLPVLPVRRITPDLDYYPEWSRIPTVTMLVTCFEREHLLGHMLKSVMSQDLSHIDLEIIVLEDGLESELNRETCKEYGAIYKFTGQRNTPENMHWRMMGYAVNIGAKISSREILIVTEAEMFQVEDCMKTLLRPLAINPYALCVTMGKFDDGTYLKHLENNNSEHSESVYEPIPVPLNCVGPYLMAMYRSRFFDVGGYDERFTGTTCDDGDIVGRLLGLGCKHVWTPARSVHLYHDTTGGAESANKFQRGRRKINRTLFEENRDTGKVVVNEGEDWGVEKEWIPPDTDTDPGIDVMHSYTSASTDLPVKLIRHNEAVIDGIIRPVHLQYSPTNKCNAKCPWCSYSKLDRTKAEMEFPEISKMLAHFKRLGASAITITGGGEPTVHPQINDILELCNTLGYSIGILSNGINFLNKEFNDAPINDTVTWLRVSVIDTIGKYNINILTRAVDLFPEIDLSFSFVVTKDVNIMTVKQVCTIAERSPNVTHVRFVTDILDSDPRSLKLVADTGNPITDKGIYQSRTKYTPGAKDCLISRLKPYIDATGNIYPCCGVQYASDEKQTLPSSFNMGNWRSFADMPAFNGSVCKKCYYDSYNKILKDLTSQIKHLEHL